MSAEERHSSKHAPNHMKLATLPDAARSSDRYSDDWFEEIYKTHHKMQLHISPSSSFEEPLKDCINQLNITPQSKSPVKSSGATPSHKESIELVLKANMERKGTVQNATDTEADDICCQATVSSLLEHEQLPLNSPEVKRDILEMLDSSGQSLHVDEKHDGDNHDQDPQDNLLIGIGDSDFGAESCCGPSLPSQVLKNSFYGPHTSDENQVIDSLAVLCEDSMEKYDRVGMEEESMERYAKDEECMERCLTEEESMEKCATKEKSMEQFADDGSSIQPADKFEEPSVVMSILDTKFIESEHILDKVSDKSQSEIYAIPPSAKVSPRKRKSQDLLPGDTRASKLSPDNTPHRTEAELHLKGAVAESDPIKPAVITGRIGRRAKRSNKKSSTCQSGEGGLFSLENLSLTELSGLEQSSLQALKDDMDISSKISSGGDAGELGQGLSTDRITERGSTEDENIQLTVKPSGEPKNKRFEAGDAFHDDKESQTHCSDAITGAKTSNPVEEMACVDSIAEDLLRPEDLHLRFDSQPSVKKRPQRRRSLRLKAGENDPDQLQSEVTTKRRCSNKRRMSADSLIIASRDLILTTPPEEKVTEESRPELPRRKSSRLRRKSMEIYKSVMQRNSVAAEEHEVVMTSLNISENTSVVSDPVADTPSSESGQLMNDNLQVTMESELVLNDSSRLSLENELTSMSNEAQGLFNDSQSLVSNSLQSPTNISLNSKIDNKEDVNYLDSVDLSASLSSLCDSKEKGKRPRGKQKVKKAEENLNDIYLNKLWQSQLPKEKLWETIFEQPAAKRPGQRACSSNSYQSTRKYRRSIQFNEFYTVSTARLAKRQQKAARLGWQPLNEVKDKELSNRLTAKMADLDNELASLETC